mmetsp:Transcript_25413/g.83579  ORF Transcript_25413/g.83579 Transcript_25413/m.83579 type:complete len:540 (-) Transcript_25413:445-2064(-)
MSSLREPLLRQLNKTSSSGDLTQEYVSVEERRDGYVNLRINCPDATGLGCDFARVMFDFGLTIDSGDFSTDGHWCFLVFKVRLARPEEGAVGTASWALLKRRLEESCPSTRSVTPRVRRAPKLQYIFQVETQDRFGLLHDVTRVLWDCELTVHRAHVTTSPADTAVDLFFVTDDSNRLGEQSRREEICSRVERMLGENVKVSFSSKPVDLGRVLITERTNSRQWGSGGWDSMTEDEFSLVGVGSLDDAAERTPISGGEMTMLGGSEGASGSGMVGGVGAGGAGEQTSAEGNAMSEGEISAVPGPPPPLPALESKAELDSRVSVKVDKHMSKSHTVLQLRLPDRQGLLYDCLRATKDLKLQVSYGKVEAKKFGICQTDLFVERFEDDAREQFVCHALQRALALPVQIEAVTKGLDAAWTELRVIAPMDISGKARPRVLLDVTTALKKLKIWVFMADVKQLLDAPAAAALDDHGEAPAPTASASTKMKRHRSLRGISTPVTRQQSSKEVHRFLITDCQGEPIQREQDLQMICKYVEEALLG